MNIIQGDLIQRDINDKVLSGFVLMHTKESIMIQEDAKHKTLYIPYSQIIKAYVEHPFTANFLNVRDIPVNCNVELLIPNWLYERINS